LKAAPVMLWPDRMKRFAGDPHYRLKGPVAVTFAQSV